MKSRCGGPHIGRFLGRYTNMRRAFCIFAAMQKNAVKSKLAH